MEQLLPDVPKMNDAERLIFEGNLRRLDNRLNPPKAEVIEFGTKEKISPEGIETLIQQKGQKSPPGTMMGNLESRVKQVEASGEELSKMKGQTLDDIMGDVMQSQKAMAKLQDEGLVRAAVRYKMMDDLQKGVLKVPKNLEEVIRGASNEEDVINVFRTNYGEDALEQVDSLVPDFYKMTSPKEAVKKIETDFPNIQPKKIEFPETVDIDKLPPEEFATGGRVGYSEGTIDPAKVKQIKQMLKMGADESTISSITGATPQQIQLVQQQKENKATGGRVGFQKGSPAIFDQLEMDVPYPYGHKVETSSKGLDYLTGMDRGNYATGGDVYQSYLDNLNDLQQKYGELNSEILYQPIQNITSVSDGSSQEDTTTTQSGISAREAISNVMSNVRSGNVNIGRSLLGRAIGTMVAGPIGGFLGGVLGGYGSTAGNAMGVDSVAGMASGPTHGVDAVNEGSVGADASAGGAAGAAAASAAGSNDGPDGGTFAEGGRVGFEKGSKPKKEKTTLSINPMMDEGFDPSKRGFLKGAAGVGAGIAALGTGALRLAKQGVKKAKDLDIIVSKNIDATDGSYGEMDYASYLYAQLKPYSEKSKKLLNKLSKEGKIKKEDNDFYVDIQDINDPSLDALEEIKKLKYDVNSADYALNPKTNKYEQVVTKIKDLRKSTSDNPFFHNSDYISDFESEAAEAAVDILQPKTGKEFIKERADMIERNLKQRGDFANGGLSYLQGL